MSSSMSMTSKEEHLYYVGVDDGREGKPKREAYKIFPAYSEGYSYGSCFYGLYKWK